MRARKYNSSVRSVVVLVESRMDKKGNVFFCVSYQNNDGDDCYVCFENMSSVLDFIKSNF